MAVKGKKIARAGSRRKSAAAETASPKLKAGVKAKRKAAKSGAAEAGATSRKSPKVAALKRENNITKRGTVGRRKTVSQAQGKADNATHIQRTALDLFAQSSFSAVTIKEIGQATGLNTAMIYYYFRDKDDLFRGAVELAVRQAMEAFQARRSEDSSPEETIANWLETHVEQLDLIRKFVKVSLDYASSGKRVARIDKAIEDFYSNEREILSQAIERGIAEQQFQPRESLRIINFISTYLDGVMIRSFVVPDFDAAGAIRRFRHFVLEQLRRAPPNYDS